MLSRIKVSFKGAWGPIHIQHHVISRALGHATTRDAAVVYVPFRCACSNDVNDSVSMGIHERRPY